VFLNIFAGMLDTAIYVGAGIDIIPVLLFRNIGTFIYVDSQPLTEFGSIKFCPEYTRPDFPKKFAMTIAKCGFRKISVGDPNTHVFVHPTRLTTIKYFMSVRFPYVENKELLAAISEANTLICCGYHPSGILLNMMKCGPKVFIGNNITIYNCEDEPDEFPTVLSVIRSNPSIISKFIRFDIPSNNYNYWELLYIEAFHVARFPVSEYKSLNEFIKTSK
jgi:hypothetical protein